MRTGYYKDQKLPKSTELAEELGVKPPSICDNKKDKVILMKLGLLKKWEIDKDNKIKRYQNAKK